MSITYSIPPLFYKLKKFSLGDGALEIRATAYFQRRLLSETHYQKILARLQTLFTEANESIAKKISDPSLLASGRLFDPKHPCVFILTENKKEFRALNNRSGTPDWVNIGCRIYNTEYIILCDIGSFNKADFSKDEFFHEIIHPYLWRFTGNPTFYLSQKMFPRWLQESIPEYLTSNTEFSQFLSLLETKTLFPFKNLEGITPFFKLDSASMLQNICYQGSRWFLDFCVKKVGGIEVILRAIQNAQKKHISVYQSFTDLTGLDFFVLEKQWRQGLQK